MDDEKDLVREDQKKENNKKSSEVAKKVGNQVKKKISESAKSNAVKKSLVKALMPVLPYILLVIFAIIIIVGIVVFLLTMPGMVMDKLKEIFNDAGNFIAAYYGADTTKQIDKVEIYETLDYLEEMGWDLKGDGFLTDYITSKDQIDSGASTDNGVNLDENIGVLRDDDDKIITANSDFIYTYMISDNYIYTIKNGNIATQNSANNWFESIVYGGLTAIYRYYNIFYGHIFDMLGINEAVGDAWGTGMLAFYYDNGLGKEGKYVNTDSIRNWDSIKVDIENQKLLIAKNRLFNHNNAMQFNLDGWTGRYGMPLEFLLSVQKATYMPDLAYDMATSFDTVVKIYLHDVSGEAGTAYKVSDSQYVDYETLENALSGVSGRNIISSTFAWVDDIIITDEEAKAALEAGIPKSPNCTTEDCGEETVCDECKSYIKQILKLLRKDNDYDFETYSPYIASVNNHWYRDVYFVLNKENQEFVKYDYDYEAVVKERWTRYETDENGDYVYYKLNDDGTLGEKYNGKVGEGLYKDENGEYRRASVGEDGVKVVKKAQTIKSTDTDSLTDLGWNNENSNSIWSAYQENSETSSSDYERAYTDEQLEDDDNKDIKEKVYVKTSTSGNITQVGEGQRTETNPEIKKMFLTNTYFRYDGSSETAEAITELRKNNEIKYGALDEDKIDSYSSVNINGNEIKVSDVSAQVTLDQDTLSAFSMLENEHTLDSDYIYRDFKELVVELGYFSKEELTDETPRLLQWIVPDVGSYGYPDRTLDKRENEYGTMVHSKGDIDANKKNTILHKLQDFLDAETESDNDDNTQAVGSTGSTLSQSVGGIDNISLKSAIDTRMVGSLDGDVSPEEVSVDEFLEAAAEVHSRMEGNFWEYCAAGTHSGASSRHTSDGSCPGNYATYEAANSAGKTADCSSYVSWVLQEVGIIKDKYNTTGMYTALAEYILTREEAGELQPGDIVLSEGHVQINGENNMQYNAGSTDAIQNPPKEYFPEFYTHVIRLPFNGTKKGKGDVYEGYKGNEAVVSPVTGVLLEYDTYTDKDKDSVSGEQYRTNVDLKYGTNGYLQTAGNTDPDNTSEGQIVTDKVGYAKILVLDKENFKKLEASLENKAVNVKSALSSENKNSLLSETGKYNDINNLSEDSIKDWSDVDNALYGYKEFAENYENAGIAGYVIYIDGFKCELPDENFDSENVDTEKPSGEELTFDSFKKITTNSFDGSGKLTANDNDVVQSKYEKDDEYKMASKKATDKLNTESTVKADAVSTITINGITLIKEGTVIGRTLTDKEVVEDYGDGARGDYNTYRNTDDSDEENNDKVVGNYLRIIMRDLDKTVVENVEDYMKLDDGEGGSKDELDYEKFLFWLGCYAENGVLEKRGNEYWSVAKDLDDGAGATHFYGLTHYNTDLAKKLGYNVSNWGDDQPLEMLSNVYVNLIEEEKAKIKKELGDDVSDGYTQAFISILHNYGNFTKRGDEYKRTGAVSESTWCTYEGTQYKEALTRRRVAEWKIITEGKYMNYNDGNTGEIEWQYDGTQYSEETPFTDFLEDHNVKNINIEDADGSYGG